jgi:hypothetical protein
MNKKKKELPLIVLKQLERFTSLQGKQFEIIDPENFLLKVVEIDDEPIFYFNIESYELNNSSYHFLMSRKPRSETFQGQYRTRIPIAKLEEQFAEWLKLLNQYESTHSFYDDPIVKAFSDEYFDDFEIIDEDADFAPLTTKQILILDEHLEYIEENIDKYKSEENEKTIERVKQDITSLRKSLTSKSKSFVFRSLCNIWGKLTKLGTQFITDFTSETKREIVKRSVKGLITLAINEGSKMLT